MSGRFWGLWWLGGGWLAIVVWWVGLHGCWVGSRGFDLFDWVGLGWCIGFGLDWAFGIRMDLIGYDSFGFWICALINVCSCD